GAIMAWDVSHSAGVLPHQLRADDIDLAFGCTYKYLNGGPGAAAFLYVHPRWRERGPGLAGWFGCDPDRQFDMDATFPPAGHAARVQSGAFAGFAELDQPCRCAGASAKVARLDRISS